MTITIDGPVASGKSSVARLLAMRLGFYYLNTGMLYRGAAYVIIHERGDGVMTPAALDALSYDQLACISDLSYEYHDNKPHVFYKNQDISQQLYSPVLDRAASIVSAVVSVRALLLDVQRAVSKKYSIVADGRDCGTVVFPDAQAKFFLTADPEIRARRLIADAARKNDNLSFEQALAQLHERDQRDATRVIAPLRQPQDALVIDNSHLTLDQTLDLMAQHVGRLVAQQ